MQPTTSPRLLQRGMVVLRTYLGLVFLSNGLAKLIGFRAIVIPHVYDGVLVSSASARSQLLNAAHSTFIAPLADVSRWIGGPGWPVFGPLLTAAELALGLGLLTGVLVRWAAIGGLLLFTPIWIMIWPRPDYLWDYPSDLVPLLIFAVAPLPSRQWLRFLDRAAPGARRRAAGTGGSPAPSTATAVSATNH